MNQIKRQSALNYYERLDEKTSESVKSRKTAVERAIEISHKLEDKGQETWQKWIQRITGCEAAVENSSCCLCAVICVLIIVLVFVAVPILVNGLSTSYDQSVCETLGVGDCWSHQNKTEVSTVFNSTDVSNSTEVSNSTDESG